MVLPGPALPPQGRHGPSGLLLLPLFGLVTLLFGDLLLLTAPCLVRFLAHCCPSMHASRRELISTELTALVSPLLAHVRPSFVSRCTQDSALPYLWKAASLEIPERSLFQWHYLYFCLVRLQSFGLQSNVLGPSRVVGAIGRAACALICAGSHPWGVLAVCSRAPLALVCLRGSTACGFAARVFTLPHPVCFVCSSQSKLEYARAVLAKPNAR